MAFLIVSMKNNPLRAVAQFDFQATSPQEISFNANQVITLAPQHLQGQLWNSGWIVGTTDRQRAGLVPVNYVKVVKQDTQKPEDWAEAVAATQSGTASPEQKAKGSSWPIMLFYSVAAATPFILIKIRNFISNRKQEIIDDPNSWQNPLRAVALYDFEASSPHEISFHANQVITLAPQHLQGELWNSYWRVGTADRQRVGFVPLNHLNVIE
ncbi:unnamed protein product [Leptidea sinapis]|uniref:SH3 domain-containing protein n=1 Tax=Leptidea sinapis TaxID=189913 RepID=A0A5E4QQ14_9NEOP|nr:unnamed protein product [Leptidea sinapis]